MKLISHMYKNVKSDFFSNINKRGKVINTSWDQTRIIPCQPNEKVCASKLSWSFMSSEKKVWMCEIISNTQGCITNSGVAPNGICWSHAADFSDDVLCEDKNQGTHQIFEFHSLNLSVFYLSQKMGYTGHSTSLPT